MKHQDYCANKEFLSSHRHSHCSNLQNCPFCAAVEVRFPICLHFVSNSAETVQKRMRVELMDCTLGHAWLSILLAAPASKSWRNNGRICSDTKKANELAVFVEVTAFCF